MESAREGSTEMSSISIGYTVPVQVVVDTDTGKVHRVVVIDEEIAFDPNGFTEDRDIYLKPVPQELIDKAHEIAEQNEWPAWDVGW
jgi:hypothetical protein